MEKARKQTSKPVTVKLTKEVVIREFTLDQSGSVEYLPTAFAEVAQDVSRDDFQGTPCTYRMPENDHPEARILAITVEVE